MKPFYIPNHVLTFAISLFIIISSLSIVAQSGCGNMRYIQDVFVDVQKTSSIQYGQNTTMAGQTKNLLLDFYEPSNDTIPMRPLIILAHGGTFIGGNRTDLNQTCINYAKKGYTVATIDYRLIDMFVYDSIAFSEIVIMAQHDMQAAVRFFKEDQATLNDYKIDSNLIFVGGYSSGAVTACHVAYLDESDNIPSYLLNHINNDGGFGGNSNALPHSNKIAGTLNFSGSIAKDYWINIGDAPIYSAHDEFDNTVPCPYGNSNSFGFDIYSYGSCAIEERANNLAIENELYLIEGSSGHVSYATNAHYDSILQASSIFMENIICSNITSSQIASKNNVQITLYPNPNSEALIQTTYPNNRNLNFEIVTLNGQTVQQGKLERTIKTDLPPGTYFFRVLENNILL